MDELDSHIIDILQKDGRASNAGIARQVGVSEGTVRRRLRLLMEDDIIRVMAVPDPMKLGYDATALIGLQVEPGSVDAVAEALAKLKEVHFVAATTGAHDLFVWVAVRSSEELGSFLKNKLGAIPSVSRTETYVNLEVKKRTYDLVV